MDQHTYLNELEKLKKNNLCQKKKIKLLENLINCIPGDIYWKDIKGNYIGLNKHGLNTIVKMGFAKKGDRIIGKNDIELFGKKNAATYRKNDLMVIEKRKKISLQEDTYLPNGSKYSQLSAKYPLINENDIIEGVIGVTLDISAIKEAEKKIKTAQDKTIFLANMSHDLRTPIAGIAGMLEALLLEVQYTREKINRYSSDQDKLKYLSELMNKTEEYVIMAKSSSYELSKLMTDILESAEIKKNEQEDSVIFNLPDLLRDAKNLLLPLAYDKGIDLKLDIDKSTPTHILVLKRQLNRVILNLLSNALKFTDQGQVKLSSKLVKNKKNVKELNKQELLEIVIEDTGIGIPRDQFSAIFKNLTRLTPSYKSNYKGSGLGLYTVKRYIKTLKGHINVESKLKVGSRFTVRIPIVIKDNKTHTDITSNNNSEIRESAYYIPQEQPNYCNNQCNNQKQALRILVVEDSLTVGRLMANILRSHGYLVDWATTGQRALNYVEKKNNYDFIYMDIGLPDLSGIVVSQKINALNQSRDKDIPIVAITGHADSPDWRKRCMAVGIRQVHQKPIQLDTLIGIITNLTTEQE